MKVRGRHAVITGAASGIGRALARRFRTEGARAVTLADIQDAPLQAVAAETGGLAIRCDVAREAQIRALVAAAEAANGPIDIFCSNAGVIRDDAGLASDDGAWQANWDIHVMAHVYAARAVAGPMAERGEGYIIVTASAAGLLTHVDCPAYAASKAASVAIAEWLAIHYGGRGVRVSALCPQAVRTAMTEGRDESLARIDGTLEPEELADSVIAAMEAETFLILPHPQVRDYVLRKAADPDRWLRGMRRLAAAGRE